MVSFSCRAQDRYLSCEAHLGRAWSYSESRQGIQTKTNYAWALLGAPEDKLERKRPVVPYSEERPGTTQKLTKGIISFQTPFMLSQLQIILLIQFHEP